VRDPAAAQQLWTVQEQHVLSETASTADMLQPRQQPQHLRVIVTDEVEMLQVLVAHADTVHGGDSNAGAALVNPSSSKGLHKLHSATGSALSTDSNKKQTTTLSHEEGAHWWLQVKMLRNSMHMQSCLFLCYAHLPVGQECRLACLVVM
jgi:hypothetical protein